MSLFAELQRRNVFRVALLYVVAAWIVLQVTDVGTSVLGLPDWTGRLVFFLLLLGLPPVLVFAWAYEITPEGLRRERDVAHDRSITGQTARKLDVAAIMLLAVAVAALIGDRLIPEGGPTSTPARAANLSVAVLPFADLSPSRDNEYFSDGLSEELLNLLAAIPELKVAARTSAFSFKNSDVPVREIGATLNVTHVLEGSVRKAGDEIRVTAQLISTDEGFHVWSRTWDRKFVDIFTIQDEIAAAVVDELKITLLREAPKSRVTDPRAYELFLRSKPLAYQNSREAYAEAISLLTEALAIDPSFADAWSQLGTIQVNQSGTGMIDPALGFERARASIERALSIEPRHAKSLATLGWIAMFRDRDFDAAARLFRRALDLEPHNPSVLNAYAVLHGVMGREDDQIRLARQALEFDPVAMPLLSNLSSAYSRTGHLAESAAIVDRMRDLQPGSRYVRLAEGWHSFFAGDYAASLAAFDALGPEIAGWARPHPLIRLGRRDEALAAVEQLIAAKAKPTQIASVYAGLGDRERAFEWLERALEENDDWLIEIRFNPPLRAMDDDPRWQRLLMTIGISDRDAERIGL